MHSWNKTTMVMNKVLLLSYLILVSYGFAKSSDEGRNAKRKPINIKDFYTDDVLYEEPDDSVVVDGDIILNKEQAAIYYSQGWTGLVNSQAWNPYTPRWRRFITVQIHKSIKNRLLENVKLSFEEIEKTTCVRFTPRGSYNRREPYIHISHDAGKPKFCGIKFVGKVKRGATKIFLADHCAGTVDRKLSPAHEIMHAMGRYHEQCRPDRNRYIEVIEGACPNAPGIFTIEPNADTLGISYDYFSIMHYSPNQCIKTSFKILKDLTDEEKSEVGQRKFLSDKDIEHINKIHCPNKVTMLVGGEKPYEGRIEVKSNNVWGTVCSNNFDIEDAKVFCKYLGYPGVKKIYRAGNKVSYITENIPILMSNLKCTGEEYSPFQCQQAPIGYHHCAHDQDVVIKCSKAAQLVGERLEVYHEGQWGSVCSYKFGYKEAKVACSMMGFSRPIRAFTVPSVSSIENKVVLTGLKCDGTESHLSSCDYELDECFNGSPVHLICN